MNDNKYERAKKQVENEKGWYTHLSVYLVINFLLQLFYAGVFDSGSFTQYFPWWVKLTTPFFWGLSLLVHWIYVFKGAKISKPFKKWEERKIQEYIDKEETEWNDTFKKE
jgi:uncharacterized ion transporter superfamily protein YfcC